jgi:hypothetical protein
MPGNFELDLSVTAFPAQQAAVAAPACTQLCAA